MSQIKGLHTGRRRTTPNANPEVANVRFIGEPDSNILPSLETIVIERIGQQTIRKNAVLCVEMLLTASPEYFRPNDPSKAGYYEPEKLADFRAGVHSWLDNEYGDRIVRAELHLDESTPHIHAYLVPLDDRGKLNCRGIFGGRQKLSQFQDSYANALSPLGLERGIKGSRAKHTHHTINITGSKFYDWLEMKGGGGAIDLVMHVNQCDYKQSVAWLNDNFGLRATIEAVTYKAQEIINTESVREFTPPVPAQDKWQSVKQYLTRDRKLPSGLVDRLHLEGLIYADNNQNAVFLRRSIDESKITGASLRGTAGDDNKFKGLAKGSKRKQGWFYFEQGEQSKDPVRRVVLVESPIDAMSLAVLERTDSKKTLYLSTDGAGQIPIEYLKEVGSVAIAFDRDWRSHCPLGNRAGREMAASISAQLPKAIVKTPKANDWNIDLVNSLDWFALNRSNEIDRGRGLSL